MSDNPPTIIDEIPSVLHVASGTQKRMLPRTYTFESIIIENEAKLIIQENSIQWLILMVKGNIRIDGELIFEKFATRPGDINATAPDGRLLTHHFETESASGAGGRGGNHESAVGGSGAPGDLSYGGGGGGSGGFYRLGGCVNGQNAVGRFGARQITDNNGGDGGTWTRNCNGGLIYLAVAGEAMGSGNIRVNGLDGAPGQNGQLGWDRPGIYGVAGGGGGGGSAGGHGGRIVLACKSIWPNLQFSSTPGMGGVGGKGGRNACDGNPGQDGVAGYIDCLG